MDYHEYKCREVNLAVWSLDDAKPTCAAPLYRAFWINVIEPRRGHFTRLCKQLYTPFEFNSGFMDIKKL